MDQLNHVDKRSQGVQQLLSAIVALDASEIDHNNQIALQYLSQLTEASWSALENEPERLEKESEQLKDALVQLIYEDMDGFLIIRDFQSLALQLVTEAKQQAMTRLSGFPDLLNTCKDVVDKSQCIIEEQRRHGLMNDQYQRVTDLLESPQLLMTLIRNGHYEEAIDLVCGMQKLASKTSHVPLMDNIMMEMNKGKETLIKQLVQQLRGNAKLHIAVRIIGYLKSINAMSEIDLRLVFLKQRDYYMREVLEPMEAFQSIELSKKMIDSLRELLFDTVSQFKAIFSDHFMSDSNPFSPSMESLNHSLLISFVSHRIHQFKIVLKNHLQAIKDTTGIMSQLTQCMYFGSSMGRIGIDFRLDIAPLFEERVSEIVSEAFQVAQVQFSQWINDNGLFKLEKVPGIIMAFDADHGAISGTNAIRIPQRLLLFASLEELTSNLYLAFNALRTAPFYTIYSSMAERLQSCLLECSLLLSQTVKQGWNMATELQKQNIREFVGLFRNDLLGAIIHGFENGIFLFKDGNKRKQYGMVKILNVSKLCQPLDELDL